MGGVGGAFTGQAAAGRMAQGTENLANTAKKFNADRKASGIIGAIKGNALDAGKAALDIGAGAAAFGNMYSKYQDKVADHQNKVQAHKEKYLRQKEDDDSYNTDTERRAQGIGKNTYNYRGERDFSRLNADARDLNYQSSQLGLNTISNNQYYDPATGKYVNTDYNSPDFGGTSNTPHTFDQSPSYYNSPEYASFSKTGRLVGGQLQNQDSFPELQQQNIKFNSDALQSIKNRGTQGVDLDKLAKGYTDFRGTRVTPEYQDLQNNTGDVAGSLAGAGMGAAGTAVDGLNSGGARRATGRTATDYGRVFSRAGKRFFNRFRRR